jgi:hypothetical protein
MHPTDHRLTTDATLHDTPPADMIDKRLLGRWERSTYESSGGFSISTYRYRVFGPDARFVEGSRSSSDAVHYDASGNWVGTNSVRTGRGRADRGTWEVDLFQLRVTEAGEWEPGDPLLELTWDDGSYAEYRYRVSEDSMLLIPSRGENQLWKRE